MAAEHTPSRGQQVTGTIATLVNFPVVFAGLLAITIGTEGDNEIALLNLWALWGISQGLLGQIAQVSGVLDRRDWTDPRALRLVPPAAVGVAVITIALADTLFPSNEMWWIAALALVIAVIVIGRQRAQLARRLDGVYALVVAALENSLRSAVMIVFLVAAAESESILGWGAVVIVGPFLVSIALLANRIETTEPPRGLPDEPPRHRSVMSGVLSGIPALAAYAIVPGLTLLDQTADLGSIAIGASLLRGPLLVATFVAPVLLERWLVIATNRPPAWILTLPAVLLGVQLAASAATVEGSTSQLAAQTVIAGLIAGLTYVLILRSLPALADSLVTIWAAAGAAAVFVVTLFASVEIGWLHPFVALSATCAAIGVALGRAAMVAGASVAP